MEKRIKTLRNEKTPDEIRQLLVNGKLGKIYPDGHGYPYIGNTLLSWLVVEIYDPGFIENHPKGTVVHHIDGNKLNNTYTNLEVMTRADHLSIHRTDPKFAEIEKVRNEKISDWFGDPANAEAIDASNKARSKATTAYFVDQVNAEAIKARGKATSKGLIAYFADPANAEAIDASHKKQAKSSSETKRKKWIDLSAFKKLFTSWEYAKASNIRPDIAYHRLRILLDEGQIACEKELIGGRRCNIYRRNGI